MTLTILNRPLIILPISGSGSPFRPPAGEPTETGLGTARLSGIASSLVAEGKAEELPALLYQNCRRAVLRVSIEMGPDDFSVDLPRASGAALAVLAAATGACYRGIALSLNTLAGCALSSVRVTGTTMPIPTWRTSGSGRCSSSVISRSSTSSSTGCAPGLGGAEAAGGAASARRGGGKG